MRRIFFKIVSQIKEYILGIYNFEVEYMENYYKQ